MMVFSAIWSILQSAILLYIGVMIWISSAWLLFLSIEFLFKITALTLLKIKSIGVKDEDR